MCLENGEKFWSSRWYKISLWSTEMQMHLGQGRNSHWNCSIKVGVHKNFIIFIGNRLCWSLFLIKLQVWRPATLLIQVFSHEYFEILKTLFWKSSRVRLLLNRRTNSICFLKDVKELSSLIFLVFSFSKNIFYPNQTFLRLDFSLFSLRFWRSIKESFSYFSLYGYALLISPIHFFYKQLGAGPALEVACILRFPEFKVA